MHSTVLTLIYMLALPLARPHPHHISPFSWSTTEAVVAFGDSYTYVQGELGRQNYSFIGDNINPSYTASELLSNEIVEGQLSTANGGPNWIEYLTRCNAGLPSRCNQYTKRQKQLWDFAFAGADVSVRDLPRHHDYTMMFDEQVSRFSAQARPYLPLDPQKTLVAVWIGINDISDSSTNATIVSFPDFYQQLQSRIFSTLDPLTDPSGNSSAFTTFLFMNLPPIEVSSTNIARASNGAPTQPRADQVKIWNHLFAKAISRWSLDRGVKSIVFDTHSFLQTVLEHPERYNIRNTTGNCPRYNWLDIATKYEEYGCLSLDQYFWYDGGHMTSHTHQILADGVGRFLEIV